MKVMIVTEQLALHNQRHDSHLDEIPGMFERMPGKVSHYVYGKLKPNSTPEIKTFFPTLNT